MRLSDAVVEFRYAKDWTPQSAKWFKSRLGQLQAWCAEQEIAQLEELTPMAIRRYITYLQERPARRGPQLDSHTVHGHVRVIRDFLNWAASEGVVDEQLAKRIVLPKRERKVLHILTDQQINLLFQAAARTRSPLRDTALVALLLDTGCRASELCGLRLDDLTSTPERAWLLVHGKGRKQRPVALGKRARLALSRYLHRERDSEEEWLFVGRKGQLKPSGLDQMLYRLRNAVGRDKFSTTVAPHRWRHTHAVKQLLAGQDIYAVSKSLGHSSIGVTTNYLQAVSDYQLMEKLSSPLDQLGK